MNKSKFDPKTGAMIIFLIVFSLLVSLKMNNYTVLVVNMASVSYTHLDVYKRQVVVCARKISEIAVWKWYF